MAVAKLPALVVTSPVKAGNWPAASVPEEKLPAFRFVSVEPFPAKLWAKSTDTLLLNMVATLSPLVRTAPLGVAVNVPAYR